MVCWIKRFIGWNHIYHPITIYPPQHRFLRKIFYQKFVYHSEWFKYVCAINRDVIIRINFRVKYSATDRNIKNITI